VIRILFKFDSLFKVVIGGAMVAGGTVVVGESVSAWDIIDTESTALEVVAIVEVADGAFTLVPAAQRKTILELLRDGQDAILAAVLADAQTRIQIGTMLEQLGANDRRQIELLEAIFANQVPIGPPGKVTIGDVLEIVEDNQCTLEILQRGRACDHIPESINSARHESSVGPRLSSPISSTKAAP
jgi:hypothetical protein